MIVKTLELRKNLKAVLEISNREELFLDYYGNLYQIIPKKKGVGTISHAQKIINKYSNLNENLISSPNSSANGQELDNWFLDQNNPDKEKESFRKLKYTKYE